MSTYALPLSWFEQRVKTEVLRNGRPMKIVNKESAPYCYNLQGRGFTFQDKEVPKPRIHAGPPDAVCVACE